MLWNRAGSNNMEPSAYNPSAAAPAAAKATLTARDERDLGDENDAGSGRPDASADIYDSASAARKRDQAEVTRNAAEEEANITSYRHGCAELSSQ